MSAHPIEGGRFHFGGLMPFKSQAQMRFMFSQHPRIAKRWMGEMAQGMGKPMAKMMIANMPERKGKKNGPPPYQGKPNRGPMYGGKR